MNIAIDARLAAKGRGLGEFAYQLSMHLPIDSRDSLHLFSYDNMQWPMANLPAGTKIINVPNSYVISEQFVIPFLLKKHHIDLFHATTNTAPLWLPSSTKLVLTIHDAMFLADKKRIPTSSSIYQRVGRKYYAAISKLLVNKADQIATISDFSKKDIVEGFSIPEQSVRVIYEGVGEEFYPQTNYKTTLQKFSIADNYFLHLGAIDQRKQTAFTIETYAKWLKEHPDSEQQLVITGVDAKDVQPFRDLAHSLSAEDKILFVGFVAKSDLISLMTGARALLLPSLYEGFGLPMLQAMACLCPVIASNATSLPEIGGDAAVYFESGDMVALIQAIDVVNKPKYRQELVNLGSEQIKKFNWNQTAQEYYSVYKSLIKE